MKGDRIPETDTISRYCPYTKISETGKPLGSAFMPRARDLESENPHISVNWLEYFKQATKQGQIQEIRNILSIKMKVSNSAKLAILKVNDIYKQFKNSNYKPKILHWPDQTEAYSDPSHAGIFDIENDPDVIADMIAQIDCDMVPAKI
jgi:hypothetical protein